MKELKEADFAETKMLINCNGDYSKKKDYKKGWQDGAEFGYNKANEWHYPSKGKYPKELENVWCYCKGLGIKFCCVGHIIIGGDNKVRWWANNKTDC